MKSIVLDTFVVFWKHFQRQSNKDNDFMASALCALCLLVLLGNSIHIIALFFGRNLSALFISSKLNQLFVAAVTLWVFGKGINAWVRSDPEFKSDDGITERYNRISRGRAFGIIAFSFLNIAMLVVVHEATINHTRR